MEIIDNDMHFFVILKMNDINNNYMNDFISDSIKRDNRTNKQVLRYFHISKNQNPYFRVQYDTAIHRPGC